jgi:hypothetical protein
MELIRMDANDTGLKKERCHVNPDGYFTLAEHTADGKRRLADICVSEKDYKGVTIAAKALSGDIELVTGRKPCLRSDLIGEQLVIVGTIGQCEWIDTLAAEGRIDVSGIAGTWETYVMETVEKPFPGVKKALVIAGSDKRGTIYGIYKLSEIIGVSVWVWWADSYPVKKRELLITDGRIESKVPSVQYRGIFINDDEPCFGGWCWSKFGGINSKMYVHVFELILRLKGNYMWPAMWGKSINIDDPESPRLADEYGIVMGTSHHEPMMRAQKEWTVLGDQYGGHSNWNYERNQEGLYRFWEDRIIANKDYEKIVTVGMRGDGDESMIQGGKIADIIALYEKIVTDQRKILAKHINPDVTKVPQMWVLYKEVEDFYSAGMKVPEDITLMLCDDNFGNVRHLPVGEMRKHKGGFGMYYHFDYVGGPFSYKWINNMPLQKTWEQMTMAYEYGIDKIWIVNVGDLKPMEFTIEYFLDLAYDIEKWGQRNKVEEYTHLWAKKEFGEEFAEDTAKVLRGYTKLNGIRKPENLFPDTFHPVHYEEADRIFSMYEEIALLAEDIYGKLPADKKDSFYQLVLYPAKASYLMYRLHIYTEKNFLYAKQGKNMANRCARYVNDSFVKDLLMSEHYNNEMSGGKWTNMMTQGHIGQTGWRSAEVNIMPSLNMVTTQMGGRMVVTVPNDVTAYTSGMAVLPNLTNIGNETHAFVIGNSGDSPVGFTITTDQEWITLKLEDGTEAITGTLQGSTLEDSKVLVSADWSKLSGADYSEGMITVTGTGRTVIIKVKAICHDIGQLPPMTFVDTQGVITIEAEHYADNVSYGDGEWKVIDDYGRTLSSMKVFPTDLPAKKPGKNAPYLEYRFTTKAAGDIKVYTFSAPTNNLSPDAGMKYAIAVDGEKAKTVDTFKKTIPVGHGKVWDLGVMQNCRVSKTGHTLSGSELHTLRIYMVDAGFVLQRIVIECDGKLLESFIGPEESYFIRGVTNERVQ